MAARWRSQLSLSAVGHGMQVLRVRALAWRPFEALFRGGGARDREQADDASAIYRDVVRVVCRAIPDRIYEPPIAVQADGEVLGVCCATMEMAGLDVYLLSADESI